MPPVMPIRSVDEEARLEVARVDTALQEVMDKVSRFEIRMVEELAGLRSSIERDRAQRARSTTKKLAFWGSVISALVVSTGAVSAALINSSATQAARAQGGEVARQTLVKEQEEREQRIVERALMSQRERDLAEKKAHEQANPIPLGQVTTGSSKFHR